MEEKAVDYAMQVFKLVFSEKMSEQLNKTFIDELLDALSEVDSSSITVDASDAHFAVTTKAVWHVQSKRPDSDCAGLVSG